MKASLWPVLGAVVTKLVAFVTMAILARIFGPEQFGSLAVAALIVGLLAIASELGLAGLLVTDGRTTPGLPEAIFGALIVASALAAAIVLGVGLTMWGLGHRELATILLAYVGSVACGGPLYFLTILMQTQMRFMELFFYQVGSAIVQLVGTLILVSAQVGISSIPWGFVPPAVVGIGFLLTRLSPEWPRPTFTPGSLWRTCRLGRAYYGQTILTFSADNTDNMLSGALVGSYGLGLYSQAFKTADIANQGLIQPIGQVAFVRMANLRAEGKDVRGPFRSALGLIALVVTPVSAVLIGAPSTVLLVLYGPNWGAAAIVLALLGARGLVRVLEVVLAHLLNASGRAGAQMRIAGITYGVSVPLMAAAAITWGIEGIASTMLGMSLMRVVVQIVAVRRLLRWPIRLLVGAGARLLVSCAVGVMAVASLPTLLPHLEDVGLLAASAALALGVQFVGGVATDPFTRDLLRNLWRSARAR